MKLLATGQTQEDQLYYVFVLRNVADLAGPTSSARAYFSWINLAEKPTAAATASRSSCSRFAKTPSRR